MKTDSLDNESGCVITAENEPEGTALALENPPSLQNRSWDGNGAATHSEDAFTRQILHALIALRNGDFSRRLPVDWIGVHGKIADAFNEILAFNERRATRPPASAAWSAKRASWSNAWRCRA